MGSLHKLAAAMALSSGIGVSPYRERYDYTGENSPRGIVFGQPRLATFTSEKPLTKRQRRRLRGKAK